MTLIRPLVTNCGSGHGAPRAARQVEGSVPASAVTSAEVRTVQTAAHPRFRDPSLAQLHTHALVAAHSASAGLAFDTAAAVAWTGGRSGEQGRRGAAAAAAGLYAIGATLATAVGVSAREGEGQVEGQHYGPGSASSGSGGGAAMCAPNSGLPSIGPYQLLKVLGDGGYGRVYLGEHDATGKRWPYK